MADAFRFEAELHWNPGNIAEMVSKTKSEIGRLTKAGIRSGTGAAEGEKAVTKALAAEKAIAQAVVQGELTALQAKKQRLDLTKRIQQAEREAAAAGKTALAEQLKSVSTVPLRQKHERYAATAPRLTDTQTKDVARQKREAEAAERERRNAAERADKDRRQAERTRNREAREARDEERRQNRQIEKERRLQDQAAEREYNAQPEVRAENYREAIHGENDMRNVNLSDEHVAEYTSALSLAAKLRRIESEWVQKILAGDQRYVEAVAEATQMRRETNARARLISKGRDPKEVMAMGSDKVLAEDQAARADEANALRGAATNIRKGSTESVQFAANADAASKEFRAMVSSSRQVIEADAKYSAARAEASAKSNLVRAGRSDIAFGATVSGNSLAADSAAVTADRNAATRAEALTIRRNTDASIATAADEKAAGLAFRQTVNSTDKVIKAQGDLANATRENAAKQTLYQTGKGDQYAAQVSGGSSVIAAGIAARTQDNAALRAEADALLLSSDAAMGTLADAHVASQAKKAVLKSDQRVIEADAELANATEVAASRRLLAQHGVEAASLSDEEAVLRAAVVKRAASELRRAQINAGMSDTEIEVVAKYKAETDRLNASLEKRIAAGTEEAAATGKATLFQRLMARAHPGREAEKQPTLGQFAGGKALTGAGFMLTGALMSGLTYGIVQTMKDASELEYTFVRIRGQLEGLGQEDSFGELRGKIKDIAVESGQSAKEVGAFMSRVLGIFGDVDVAAEETRAAMRLAVVASVELESVQQDLIPIMKSFHVSATQIGDTVVGMRDKFGIAEESSLSFLGKTAVVAEQAGLGMRELGVIGGYMANSLGKDLGASADVLNKLPSLMEANQMKIYSILNRNTNTRSFVDPMMKAFGSGEAGKAFTTLIKAMGSMDDKQKQAILTSVVSRREAEELNAVLANSENITNDLADATVLGADASGKLNQRFHSMSDTVKHTFESLGSAADNFGESLFKLGIADAFINVGKAAGGVLGIVSALSAAFEKFDEILNNIIPFKEIFGSGPMASMVQFLGTVFLISKGLGFFNKVRKEGIGASTKAAIAEAVETGTRNANAAAATVEAEAVEKTVVAKSTKPQGPMTKKKVAAEEEDFTKGLDELKEKERKARMIKEIADEEERKRKLKGKKPPPLPKRPGTEGAEDTSGRKPPPPPPRPTTEGRPPPPTTSGGPPPLPRRPGATGPGPLESELLAEQKRAKGGGLFRRRRGEDDTTDALNADSAARTRSTKATRDGTKAIGDHAKAMKASETQYGASAKWERRASAAHEAEARRRNDLGAPVPSGFGGSWTPGMVAAQEDDRLKSDRRAAKNQAAAEKAAGGKAPREGRVLKSGGKISKGLSAIGFDPASIAITGAIMTMEAWQNQKTGLDAQVEGVKANMKKMSTQQLADIAKQENSVMDNLSSFLFHVDLPNKLAEFEKRMKEGGESRKTVLAMSKQTPAKMKSSPDAYGKTKTLADLFAKTVDEGQIGRMKEFFQANEERAKLAEELGIEIGREAVPDPDAPGGTKFINKFNLTREKIAELPAKVAKLTEEGKNEEAKNLQNLIDAITKDKNMEGLRNAINTIQGGTEINEMVNSLGAEDFVGAGFQELEELYEAGKIGTKQMMGLYQKAIADKEKQVKLIEDPAKREAAYAELNKFRKRYEEFDKIAMDREIKNITGLSNISGTSTPLSDQLHAKLRVLPGHKFETQATQYSDLLQETADAFNEDTDKIADGVQRAQVRGKGFTIDPAIRRLRFAADPEASAVMSGLKDLTNQSAEYYSDFIQGEMDRTGEDATTVMLNYLDTIIGIIAQYEPEGETIKKYKALRDATAAGAFEVPDPGKVGKTDQLQNTADKINADADRWKAQLSRRKSEVAADPLATAIVGRDEARAEVARLERLKNEAPKLYNPDDMEKAIAQENDANRQIQSAEDAIVDAKLGWAEVLANGDPVKENAARMVLAKEKLRRAIRDNNQAAIDQAGQDIERLNQEAVNNNNDIISARMNVQRALVEDDPVKSALAGLQESEFAESIAKGEAAKLNAAAERIRAQKGLEEAINENFASRNNLLQALANAAGHPVEASRLALAEEQRQLTRLLGKGLAMDSTPVQDQLGKVATATRSFLDTDVAEQTDLIDFALEMRQITVAQAIAGYRVQQARYAKDDRAWRDLERKIQSLQGQGAEDLQFNLPSTLGLPTMYEARRMNQSNGMGVGYQDNRNTVVTIAVNGAQDPMAVAGQVMAAFQSATKASNTFSGAVSTGV
jgi:hypothetical protein